MRTGEKVIVIVGLWFGLATLAATLSWLVVSAVLEDAGGWFAYSPNVEPIFADAGNERAWAALWTMVIWLATIATWVALSLRIWRGDDSPETGTPTGFLARMRQRD